MSTILAVPVRIDALFVENDRFFVLPPSGDFSKLPYSTSKGDVNAETAWISEEIVPHPFEAAALLLKPGLHLHWALPDSYLRGINQGHIEIDPRMAKALTYLSSDRPSAVRPTNVRILLQELKAHGILLSENITVSAGEVSWHLSDSNYRFKITAEPHSGEGYAPKFRLSVRGRGIHRTTSVEPPREDVASLDHGIFKGKFVDELTRLGIKIAGKLQTRDKEQRWYLEDPDTDQSYAVTAKEIFSGHPARTLRLHSKGIVFPALPNRWLVQRRRKSDVDRWVIESDSLGFKSEGRQDPIWFPIKADGSGPPCQRLGRVLKFDAWTEEKQQHPDRYLHRLTAAGYGDPTFTTFYPNCHSVFGFHDPEINAAGGEFDYQIVGWHSAPDDDPLRTARFQDGVNAAYGRYNLDPASVQDAAIRNALFEEALEAVHGWNAGLKNMRELMRGQKPVNNPALPERTVLVGSVSVNCSLLAKSAGTHDSPSWRDSKCRVALGHSVTEALSAFAAANVSGDPALIEDQIEAMHLLPKLEALRIDIGPKFREARHEKEFAAVDAGRRWTVVPGDTGAPQSEPVSLEKLMTPQITEKLQALNKAEAKLDQISGELAALRRQLYSDWCKYMICAYPPLGAFDEYPDMDAVRALIIEETSLPAVTKTVKDRRDARKERNQRYKELEALLNPQHKPASPLVLKDRPATRFWRPKEPVLLIEGESIVPSLRHGNTELLRCAIKDFENIVDSRFIKDQVLKLAAAALEWTPQHLRSSAHAQPWNPIFLDWRIEMMPAEGAENVLPNQSGYAPDFISKRFEFDAETADLEPNKLGRAHDSNASTEYQGRSILTPHAGTRLRNSIEEWMCKKLKLDPAKPEENAEKVRSELSRLSVQPGADAAANIAKAYCYLFGEKEPHARPFMAQALTGFNAALLMQRQTMQLPITDPLGFEKDRAFARKVAKAVAGENLTAPQPQNQFHPIRTGRVKIIELRLVDTFGQARNLVFDPNALITAESMSSKEFPRAALLSPRIVQPARVKFRWLAAEASAEQLQDATDSRTALCGWVVHDLARDGLLVHAADGTEIGRISSTRHWHEAPAAQRIAPWQIENPHLARLVTSLLQDQECPSFIAALDSHLGTIIPAEFAEQDGIQLLLGRPLAVVRAKLELQIFGPPASNHDWTVFQSELHGAVKPGTAHAGFDKVRFPVRLGDEDQFNDGLAAFWVETHHPDGRCTLAGPARTSAERKEVELSVAGGPVAITMLIDPRAPVHARSGILPAKSIALPKAHYSDILSRMSTALPVGPLLCPQDHFALYAPDTARFAVSWIEFDRGTWIEAPVKDAPSTQAEWSGPVGIREGWIKLTPKTPTSSKT